MIIKHYATYKTDSASLEFFLLDFPYKKTESMPKYSQSSHPVPRESLPSKINTLKLDVPDCISSECIFSSAGGISTNRQTDHHWRTVHFRSNLSLYSLLFPKTHSTPIIRY